MTGPSPVKSGDTHLLSLAGWTLAFSPKGEKGGRSLYTMTVSLQGEGKSGLTVILPEELGVEWGFDRQPCGNYWFQVGTANPQYGLSVLFARRLWDHLIAEGWRPVDSRHPAGV